MHRKKKWYGILLDSHGVIENQLHNLPDKDDDDDDENDRV